MVRVLVVAMTVGAFSACAFPEMPPDQACLEAGYAIASRTVECTGDAALANERYDALFEAHTCALTELPRRTEDAAKHFTCAAAMNDATCADVIDNGDDLDWWLSLDTSCRTIFGLEGSEQPGGRP